MSATTDRKFKPLRRMLTAAFASLLLTAAFTGCDDLMSVLDPPPAPSETLKIGVIQPSQYYSSFARGAEIARMELNAAGGVLGMPVEFVVRDNQGTDIFPTTEKYNWRGA